ncbi:MAG: hypothetical protein J7L07_11170 [Candidatus Odinarchaeota archaeon]|nr:hypothetical protein [Candidatus Odinarchaeota archaeon]
MESKLLIKITFIGIGDVLFELRRIYAPRTIDHLVNKLPFKGRAIPQRNTISIPIGLKMSIEKGHTFVKSGDIAYWPLNDTLVIYMVDSKTYSPVNLLGKSINDILEIGRKIKTGTMVTIEAVNS